jgi:hypothetical protein
MLQNGQLSMNRLTFTFERFSLSMSRPNRRKVLECGGCDTALERCCCVESGVALRLPPHSKTQTRNCRFITSMRAKSRRLELSMNRFRSAGVSQTSRSSNYTRSTFEITGIPFILAAAAGVLRTHSRAPVCDSVHSLNTREKESKGGHLLTAPRKW